MTYTHIFSRNTKELRPLTEATEALRSVAFCVRGYALVDINRVVFDKHGQPSYNHGGWSYGHCQNGWLCAGAGGLNSLRVLPLQGEKEYV